MSSYTKYQNNFRKYAGHTNVFKAPKVMVKEKVMTEEWKERIINWNTYYRRNIHRFIQHYFGVKLYWYQIIWLYFMSISEAFVTIASRASAKSWLIALFALARGVLYPNSEIVIVSRTQKQAGIILNKVDMLRKEHPNIAREIANFYNSFNNRYCELHNGSTIKVVACTESGRGERSTFTIAEEFRLMNKEKYDSIVKPFSYARQAPYLQKPEYYHLIEEPREVMISSAYHKAEWWYKETITVIKMMLEGKNAGFIAFDYPIAIKHGIKTRKQILREKATMDEITFMEEYENIPFGENSDAYFKFNMFRNSRSIKKAFYPLRSDMLNKKKNPYNINRKDGEIRIVAVDASSRKGEENDNTIITCIRALPTTKGYVRDYVYMEMHHGEHTGKQALRIKQIYYDFEADYIVLDLYNIGIAIFERLATVTRDDERGVEYDAFTVYEHKSLDKSLIEELEEKTLATKAKPVIYPILATAKMNSDIAVDFRDKLKRGMINFLIDENEAEDYLLDKDEEFARTEDVALRAWHLHPYRQFSELIIETVSLKSSIVSGNIKLEEVGNKRKDRYTSCSYGGYFISLLEKELLKKEESNDLENFFITPSSTPWKNYHSYLVS